MVLLVLQVVRSWIGFIPLWFTNKGFHLLCLSLAWIPTEDHGIKVDRTTALTISLSTSQSWFSYESFLKNLCMIRLFQAQGILLSNTCGSTHKYDLVWLFELRWVH